MLVLKDVTLVIIDTQCPELTKMAVADCLKHAQFGNVEVINELDVSPLEFAIYRLPFMINTQFVFFIQWDSWIIDAAMWTDDFLMYDYIGAPWWYTDGLNVGNSGFNIRSIDLMKHVARNKATLPVSTPEDDLLCRQYRPKLPQFKWAPEDLAQRFAFERTRPSISSRHFGFHGMFNWPFVLPPDKLAERMELARANPYIKQSGMLAELDNLHRALWQTLGTNLIYHGVELERSTA